MLDLTKIVDVEVDGIDMKDYPDFCDAYISEAWIEMERTGTGKPPKDFVLNTNTGKCFRKLTENELDWLNNNHSDFVYEKVINHLY